MKFQKDGDATLIVADDGTRHARIAVDKPGDVRVTLVEPDDVRAGRSHERFMAKLADSEKRSKANHDEARRVVIEAIARDVSFMADRQRKRDH